MTINGGAMSGAAAVWRVSRRGGEEIVKRPRRQEMVVSVNAGITDMTKPQALKRRPVAI
jgi:hypothetical protein